MQHVAADRHHQPLDAALGAAHGQGVEQGLGRMFMGAVAGVDHGAIDFSGQKMRGARLMMAHHDDVRPHGVERDRGVDQRLALFHRTGRHRHVHHIGAQPFASKLKRALGAGRGLEKQVDQGAARERALFLLRLARHRDRLLGEIEQMEDVEPVETLDAQKVLVGEGKAGCGHFRGSI